MRWLPLLLMVALLAPQLAPVSARQPDALNPLEVELHEGLVGRIGKLSPLFANTNPVDRDITALIYEGLTTINQYGEVVPDLASGWIVSVDGLEYIFFLREDVLWQDGIVFSAHDVAYTFRTIRHPDFPGDPALRDFWQTVEIEVIDDFTLRFRLVQPLAAFPEKLRQGIVPLHALEGAPIASLDQHPFNLSPIGTGAYQIESLFAQQGQLTGISLRVAPNYRIRPEVTPGSYAIDRIVFRTYPTLEAATEAYVNGEINSLGAISNDVIVNYRSFPNLSLHTALAPSVGVLIYNWQRDDLAYFRDQRFRLAMQLATDRYTPVYDEMIGRAVVADTTILPTSWAYNAQAAYPPPDLSRANALLQQVSFDPYQPPNPDVDEFNENEETEAEAPPPVEQRRNFSLMVIDDPGVAGIGFEITKQWQALGFGVQLDMVDTETYAARLQSGDFDVAIVEYRFDPGADPDQFTFWHGGQVEAGQNYGHMNDSYINDLLLEARTDPNTMHRKEYYDEFQSAFTLRAPALVLYYPIFVYATAPNLQNVQLDYISSPADRFRTIADWSFSLPS